AARGAAADGWLACESVPGARAVDQRDQRLEEGRRARAIRADEGDRLAGLDVDRDAEERLEVTVERVESLDLKQRHRHGTPCRSLARAGSSSPPPEAPRARCDRSAGP